jgi:hypothetical protein
MRLDSMETTHRREKDTGDVSEAKSVEEAKDGENVAEDAA